MEKRNAMFLWRGPNLQRKRKSCQNACADVRDYKNALGDEYTTVYFSCSYLENGNNETVKDTMLNINAPIAKACKNDDECMRATSCSIPVLSVRAPDWWSVLD